MLGGVLNSFKKTFREVFPEKEKLFKKQKELIYYLFEKVNIRNFFCNL